MNEILIIIAFNLIVYFRTLKFTIIVDDIRWYKRIDDGMFKDCTWRNFFPMRLYGGGTFGVKPIKVMGSDIQPQLDHLFTTMIHTTICVLMYLALGHNSISFWGAMLYACNPINNQTSIWLNGRRYAINIILVLLMILMGQMKYGWMAWPVLYVMTAAFHATAVLSPILTCHNPWIALMVLQVFLLLKGQALRHKYQSYCDSNQNDEMKKFGLNKLIVVVKAYGIYFFRMFASEVTMINYPELFFWGVTKEGNDDAYRLNSCFYKGCLSLAITTCACILLPGNFKLYAIYGALATLQWSSIFPSSQTLADRYVSMPNVFMMVILSYLIHLCFPHFYIPILIAIMGIYCGRLKVTMLMYKDLWNCYDYQIFFCPWITMPRANYITYLINSNDYLKAWQMTRDGLKYLPNDFSLLTRAAICAKAIGGRHQSKEYIDKAEKHFYINQEKDQQEWIRIFRKNL